MARYTENERQSINILRAANRRYGDDLWFLSSFGVDSALTLHLANEAEVPLYVVGIDTGFQFDETYEHQDRLEQLEDFSTVMFGPSPVDKRAIAADQLWQTDLDEYNRLTKLEPLSRAIRHLGIRALVTGVRRDQTENRSGLGVYSRGGDGEMRVNSVLNWSQAEVDEYFNDKSLPRHPLYYRGFGSVGDWTLTRPGDGRSGRNLGEKSECGINLPPAPEMKFARGVLATQVTAIRLDQ